VLAALAVALVLNLVEVKLSSDLSTHPHCNCHNG